LVGKVKVSKAGLPVKIFLNEACYFPCQPHGRRRHRLQRGGVFMGDDGTGLGALMGLWLRRIPFIVPGAMGQQIQIEHG